MNTEQTSKNIFTYDYILVKRQHIKLVCVVKVIPNEECVTQHKLLVCDARIVKSEDWCKKFVSKRRVWKLQQADLCDKFVKLVGEMSDTSSEQVGNIWSRLKQDLLSATEKTCWWTREGIWRKQTWRWNETVSKDISEKRRLWNLWKTGGSKDKYLNAKWKAQHAVYTARRNVENSYRKPGFNCREMYTR